LRYSDFVHLHVHSDYSLLDGAGRISDYIERAMELRMPAMALTDHGSMFGAVTFYKQALKAGLKPLIGCELYVARTSRLDRKPGPRGVWDAGNHLILLAKDLEGYHNLMQLSSRGYTEGFYYKPRVDMDLLSQYSDGLVALTACLKGLVGEDFACENEAGARERAGLLADIYGSENVYLEIQRHGLPEEEKIVKGMIGLSKELGLSVVATNDCHYLAQEDSRAQDIMLCLQTGKDLDDPNRLKFFNDQFYFKSSQEMKALFAEVPEAVTNTVGVAEKCNLDLELGRIRLPDFPLPEGYADANQYLEYQARQGMEQRYPGAGPDIRERMAYELRIIEEMNYSSYFLIIRDLVNAARDMGIPVGPGRGSAAGSIVSYCLRITDIDPLRFGLLFERFLNPERISMPDIDIDFCDKRRSEVIDYVSEKYGRESVSQIITFGTMAARGAIRDVGRVLKVPIPEVDRIAKLIPPDPGVTIDSALDRVPELRQIAENEKYSELIRMAKKLEGLARHASTHAAGVLITPGKLVNYVPLYRGSKGEIVTQYDMKSVESIGLLKMDFLGLTTLSIVEDTLKMIKQRQGVEVETNKIPLDDPDVFRLLAEGRTVGVFQLESSGMRDLLRRMKPERFEDIIATNALYRPGPLGSEMVELFIKRKRGQKDIDYEDALLEPILKDTYGVILYQEQVIEIANKLGGFTKGQADILRRAMGKKAVDMMDQQRRNFVKGAVDNGLKEESAERIFSQIAYFAGYGFNKSHSAAYALLSYHTAFLKAKYPREFMAACLTSEIGNTDRIVILLDECRRMGIRVHPPDINQSDADFTVNHEGIRFGLAAIKNVGRSAIQSIVNTRNETGPFKTVFELCEKVDLKSINKRMLESLVFSGALDSLKGHRAQLLAGIESAMSVGQKSQRDKNTGQTSLLRILETKGEKTGIERKLPQIEEWSLLETLSRERDVLGFYCSGHPLSRYKREIDAFTTAPIAETKRMAHGKRVVVAGIVAGKRIHFGRNGKKIGFVQLEDLTGQMEAVFFDDQITAAGDRLADGSMILVLGTVSYRNEDQPKIRVGDFMELENSMEKLAGRVEIDLDAETLNQTALDMLNRALDSYPGRAPVSIVVVGREMGDVVMQIPQRRIKPTRDVISALDGIEGVANVRLVSKVGNRKKFG
jgi:DNA polymerase-3 subunit alpha